MRLLALPVLVLLIAGCTGAEPAAPDGLVPEPDGASEPRGVDGIEAASEDDAPAGSGDADAGTCPGHWHAAVTFFVHDDRVAFTQNPRYTLEGGTMPLRTHLHTGSESIWHFEPSERECIPLREALATVDVRLEASTLELSGDYHAENGWGGLHEEDGERLLRAWNRPHGGDWAPVEVAELAAMQVPDGAQVLVAFGAHDEADVARMQDEAYVVPANLAPRDS